MVKFLPSKQVMTVRSCLPALPMWCNGCTFDRDSKRKDSNSFVGLFGKGVLWKKMKKKLMSIPHILQETALVNILKKNTDGVHVMLKDVIVKQVGKNNLNRVCRELVIRLGLEPRIRSFESNHPESQK